MMKCETCGGTGCVGTEQRECPECRGRGKMSLSLGEASESDLMELLTGGKCERCGGSGRVEVRVPCPVCAGSGELGKCKLCGRAVPAGRETCEQCATHPTVLRMDSACDVSDLKEGMLLLGVVSGHFPSGKLVSLNKRVRGIVRSRNIGHELNEQVVVRVRGIRGNDVELEPVDLKRYTLLELEKDIDTTPIEHITEGMVRIEGEVVSVRQTAGPTLFTVRDDTGTIKCAAFDGAGVRAYPSISEGTLVRVVGEAERRADVLQIEVLSMRALIGGEADTLKKRLSEALRKLSTPREVELLVESEPMKRLYEDMQKVARRLLECVYTSTPIIIRHHADADGITAAVCLEQALLPLIREVSGDEDAHYLLRRSPSRAPFYEMMDVVKDLDGALLARERFGQKLPLVILVDNGSGQEDVDALKLLSIYGIPTIVVDHHHPSPLIDELVDIHVNPALAGGDYSITTGMLCLEIARMIHEGADRMVHLAAVSALGDRASGQEAQRYIELATARYPLEHLSDMALSLDYLSYWLRFSEGTQLVCDVLDLSARPQRHARLVELLSTQAKRAIEEQLAVCLPHVKTTHLPNGILLAVLDVEHHAHTFTFPPPGKSVGEVHDHICRTHEDEPVVTIGYGPDFAVIRSRGVEMNFPEIVSELAQKLEGAGISGGGHLVVGSIKFVQGMRKQVLEALAERLGRIQMEG